jgi:hypothetical protein
MKEEDEKVELFAINSSARYAIYAWYVDLCVVSVVLVLSIFGLVHGANLKR